MVAVVEGCLHSLTLCFAVSRMLGDCYRSDMSPQRRESTDKRHFELAIIFNVIQLT
jgi:hypothetical protein